MHTNTRCCWCSFNKYYHSSFSVKYRNKVFYGIPPFLSLVLKLLASFMSRHHGWLKQKVSFQACQRAKIVFYIPLYFTHHIANSMVVSYWVSILWNVLWYNWNIWKIIQQGIVWEKRNLKVINLHQLPIYFLCKNLENILL